MKDADPKTAVLAYRLILVDSPRQGPSALCPSFNCTFAPPRLTLETEQTFESVVHSVNIFLSRTVGPPGQEIF